MSDKVLIDSDVILKMCSYQIVIAEGGPFFSTRQYYALTINRFTAPKRLIKSGVYADRKLALKTLQLLFENIALIEPSVEELTIAADLELQAQRAGLQFHVGESQLLAILVVQSFGHLLTGDKQAICALPGLSAGIGYLSKAEGKIICFEQLILCLLVKYGSKDLRAKVCSCPHADKTLAFCFACNSPEQPEHEYTTGLQSNIANVRNNSGKFLIAEADLLPVSP